MKSRARRRVRRLALALDPEFYGKVKKLSYNDLGFGYDPFGLEKESAMLFYLAAGLLYKHYFRVESHGNGRGLGMFQGIIQCLHSNAVELFLNAWRQRQLVVNRELHLDAGSPLHSIHALLQCPCQAGAAQGQWPFRRATSLPRLQ